MGMAAFGRAVLRFPEATARKARTFSRPAWVGSTTSTIRITKVEFADTATIISFHERYKPGWWIRMSKDSWLLGDDNRKYKALRGEGHCAGGTLCDSSKR